MDHLEQLLHTLQTIEQTRGFLQRRCATGLAGQSLSLFEDLASLMELVKAQYGHTDYVPRYIPDYHHSTDVLEALAYLNQVEDWSAEVRRRIDRRRLRRQLANQSPLEVAAAEGKPFVSTAREMAQMAQIAAPFAEAVKPITPPPNAASPEERAASESGVTVELSSSASRKLTDEEIRRLPQSQQVKYFYDLRRQKTAAQDTSVPDILEDTSTATPSVPYLTPGEAGARVADAAERAMATPAATFSQSRLDARRAQRKAAEQENPVTGSDTPDTETEPQDVSVSIPEATREHPPQGSSPLARESAYRSGSDQTKPPSPPDTRPAAVRERPSRHRGGAVPSLSGESAGTTESDRLQERPSRRFAGSSSVSPERRAATVSESDGTRPRPTRHRGTEADTVRERPSRRNAASAPSSANDRSGDAVEQVHERPARRSDAASPASDDKRPGNAEQVRERPSRRGNAIPPASDDERPSDTDGVHERLARRSTATPPSPLDSRIIHSAQGRERPSRRSITVPPSPLDSRIIDPEQVRERPSRHSTAAASVKPTPPAEAPNPAHSTPAQTVTPEKNDPPIAHTAPTIQPKSRLAWEADQRFSVLTQQLNHMDPQNLYHQLIQKFSQLEPRYQLVIGDTLRKNSHLGVFSPEHHRYEALERRAFQLCSFTDQWTQLYHRLTDMRSKTTLLALMSNWYDFNIRDASNVRDKIFLPYLDLDILGLRENEVLVDCGAYVGDVTKAFIKTMRQYQHIFAFEPDPSSFSMLESHLSEFDNITLSQKVVLDNQSGALLMREAQPSMSRCSPDGTLEVRSTALDEEITRRITFLKISVCGSESAVLRGAADHIAKEKPRLAVCADYSLDTLWKIPKLLDSITPGYQYYLRHYGGNLVPLQYVLYAVHPSA